MRSMMKTQYKIQFRHQKRLLKRRAGLASGLKCLFLDCSSGSCDQHR